MTDQIRLSGAIRHQFEALPPEVQADPAVLDYFRGFTTLDELQAEAVAELPAEWLREQVEGIRDSELRHIAAEIRSAEGIGRPINELTAKYNAASERYAGWLECIEFGHAMTNMTGHCTRCGVQADRPPRVGDLVLIAYPAGDADSGRVTEIDGGGVVVEVGKKSVVTLVESVTVLERARPPRISDRQLEKAVDRAIADENRRFLADPAAIAEAEADGDRMRRTLVAQGMTELAIPGDLEYAARVAELERDGLSTSDAQAAADAELLEDPEPEIPAGAEGGPVIPATWTIFADTLDSGGGILESHEPVGEIRGRVANISIVGPGSRAVGIEIDLGDGSGPITVRAVEDGYGWTFVGGGDGWQRASDGGTALKLPISRTDMEEEPMAEYYASLEADERRARERIGKEPPHKWGDDLGNDTYFCLPEWQRGDETGAHPHSDPPCDPNVRGER